MNVRREPTAGTTRIVSFRAWSKGLPLFGRLHQSDFFKLYDWNVDTLGPLARIHATSRRILTRLATFQVETLDAHPARPPRRIHSRR
jgi:hypothetical protein